MWRFPIQKRRLKTSLKSRSTASAKGADGRTIATETARHRQFPRDHIRAEQVVGGCAVPQPKFRTVNAQSPPTFGVY